MSLSERIRKVMFDDKLADEVAQLEAAVQEGDQRFSDLQDEHMELEAENAAAFELLDVYEKENEKLWEYFNAHMAVEMGLATFDLHNDAVKRLEDARDALKEGG